ncbi:MAG: GIY-YIG nuclease family protein [Candidatus Omnitrophica bacterium]|nr:GIY-YIG nuclease family protein [Candidatus Omnitrophota bacterium]
MYVYILRSCKGGTFYVGSTKNVDERVKQHNRKESLSTKFKAPWELVKVEKYDSDSLALKRERFLKTGRGRSVLRNLCSID